MPSLPPLPDVDDTEAVVAWVAEHLGHLTLEGADGVRPGGHRGGQAAADAAPAPRRVDHHALEFAVGQVGGGRLAGVAAHGAGAESRTQIGWVIVGGMSFGTLLTLFVVPVAYSLLARKAHVESHGMEPDPVAHAEAHRPA